MKLQFIGTGKEMIIITITITETIPANLIKLERKMFLNGIQILKKKLKIQVIFNLSIIKFLDFFDKKIDRKKSDTEN